MLQEFNIDKNTENVTTKPPITKTVEIAFWILLPKIFPRLLRVIVSKIFDFVICFVENLDENLLFFVDNLPNIIPTEIAARIWVIKRRNPVLVSPNSQKVN